MKKTFRLFFSIFICLMLFGCGKKKYCYKNEGIKDEELYNILSEYGTKNSLVPLYASDTHSYKFVDEWIVYEFSVHDNYIEIFKRPKFRQKEDGSWDNTGNLQEIWDISIEKSNTNDGIKCSFQYYEFDQNEGEKYKNLTNREFFELLEIDIYDFSDDKILKNGDNIIEIIIDDLDSPIRFDREKVVLGCSNYCVVYDDNSLSFLSITNNTYSKLYK